MITELDCSVCVMEHNSLISYRGQLFVRRGGAERLSPGTALSRFRRESQLGPARD